MKGLSRLWAVLTLVLMHFSGISQVGQPVRWSFKVNKIAPNKYELRMTALIDAGWHLYSQKQPEPSEVYPTRLKLNNNPLVLKSGSTNELGDKIEHKDEILGQTQYLYKSNFELVQVLEVKAGVKTQISGEIEYQACTDMSCLSPNSQKFLLDLR